MSVEVVDKAGRVQPNENQKISFSLSGPGTIAGLGNADLKNEEPYQGAECHVYHGRALVVLRGAKQHGNLDLKAEAQGLESARAMVTSK